MKTKFNKAQAEAIAEKAIAEYTRRAWAPCAEGREAAEAAIIDALIEKPKYTIGRVYFSVSAKIVDEFGNEVGNLGDHASKWYVEVGPPGVWTGEEVTAETFERIAQSMGDTAKRYTLNPTMFRVVTETLERKA